MRKTGIWLSLLAMVVCAGSASAITISSGVGGGFDWFTYGGPVGNTWTGATPGAGVFASAHDNTLSPGGGGQNFDIEQVFWRFDGSELTGGVLYVGIVTGFDPAGVLYGGDMYYAGDLFLNIGEQLVSPAADYDYAIGTGTEAGRNLLGWELDAGYSVESVNVPGHVAASNPYRVDEVASGALATSIVGNFGVNWQTGIQGDHNLLEVALLIDPADATALEAGLGIHWTMSCGNDLLPVVADPDIPDTPQVPVPEPATMVLLGMGVLGIALRARRPQC